MASTGHTYKKAPITEAVIEIRFAQPISKVRIEKAARLLKNGYVLSDEENVTEFKVNPALGQVEKPTTEWLGVKLSSLDRADVVVLRTTAFLCARLAPYHGWETFRSRAAHDWGVLAKLAGHPRIVRLGMRYINRLDIPATAGSILNLDDYLNVGPRLPVDQGAPISSFSMQVRRPLRHECNLILNSGSVLPPLLLGHSSVALDIDVSRETNLPQREDDLWDLLETMRDLKNDIFEKAITDQSRKLFDQ